MTAIAGRSESVRTERSTDYGVDETDYSSIVIRLIPISACGDNLMQYAVRNREVPLRRNTIVSQRRLLMKRLWHSLFVLALLALAWPGGPQGAAPAFTDPAFTQVWTRTDQLVADGKVGRTWFWGPQPNTGGIRE